MRHSIAALGERVDAGSATASWVSALGAPEWHEAPTWLHGGLTPGNLLLVDGRLSAIVDVERCSQQGSRLGREVAGRSRGR